MPITLACLPSFSKIAAHLQIQPHQKNCQLLSYYKFSCLQTQINQYSSTAYDAGWHKHTHTHSASSAQCPPTRPRHTPLHLLASLHASGKPLSPTNLPLCRVYNPLQPPTHPHLFWPTPKQAQMQGSTIASLQTIGDDSELQLLKLRIHFGGAA